MSKIKLLFSFIIGKCPLNWMYETATPLISYFV